LRLNLSIYHLQWGIAYKIREEDKQTALEASFSASQPDTFCLPILITNNCFMMTLISLMMVLLTGHNNGNKQIG